jgi:hypothetical protein
MLKTQLLQTSRHTNAVAILVASLAGVSTNGLAAPPTVEPALRAMQNLNNYSLPGVAIQGTGFSGTFNHAAMNASDLSIPLPDGRELHAQRERIAEDRGRGHKSWIGTFIDEPGSIAVFSTVRGVTTGFITYGAETWEIMPGEAGQHVLYRVDESKLSAEDTVLVPDVTDSDLVAVGDYGADSASTEATTSGYVHDLLVVYTPKVRSMYGQATLESMVQNAVQLANQAYQNSRIGITLNLVGLQEIAYVESGKIDTTLADLQGGSDGKMDSVHRLRDSVGADVVSLVAEDSSICGIAWSMRTESASNSATAFNVVKPGCLSQHSLAHEIGHNQGSMHDRDSTTNVGVFPYSYGFRRCMSDGTGFRTVMSYSCTGAKRVAWFSNPNVYYNGYAMGIPYESKPASSADNARSMNNTADTVAAFRSGGGSTVAPSTPPAPSSLSATATSSSSVTLRWSDNSADETGFKVASSTDGVNFAEVATLGAGTTSFSNNGLAALTTYHYRVRAYNSAGNSAYSNTASVKTPDATLSKPAAPSSLSGTASSSTVTVRWTDNSGNETGFKLYRSTNGVDFMWITTLGANATSYSNSGLKALTTYFYKVRAYNSAGGSAYSNTASAKTSDSDAGLKPSAPTNVKAANKANGSALVSWTDASTNETGFEVRRRKWDAKLSAWGSWVKVASVGKGITSVVNAPGNGTYAYSVRAANAAGTSSWTGLAKVTITGAT